MLKLSKNQKGLVDELLNHVYVMTTLFGYGKWLELSFASLNPEEEKLLLRYLGGDKTVKIEVVE